MKSPVALNEAITLSFPLNGYKANETTFIVKDFKFFWDQLFKVYQFSLTLSDPKGNDIEVETDKKHNGRDIVDLINSRTKLSNLYLDYFDPRAKNPTVLYNGKRYSIQRSFPRELLLIHNAPVDVAYTPEDYETIKATKVIVIDSDKTLFDVLMSC